MEQLSVEEMFGGFGPAEGFVKKRKAPADLDELESKNDVSSGGVSPKKENSEQKGEEAKEAKGFADMSKIDPSEHNKHCLHEVAVPEGMRVVDKTLYDPQMPEKLAWTYEFELDPFQRSAVACIERDESVLVSAHTSAGKTAVAEYAIAKGLQARSRVLYTSPIKALSNQKYRELHEDFHDVGLVTGDVTINMEASCIVLTTEILRSMLYRGSEILREVHWVIFDEVHYMRDKERGVVWEETLILLPDETRFVFLSATIPNAREFAQWIADLHKQPCHVVYTEFRPVPLQHYLFPAGGEGVYLVVDEKGGFREKNFQKALTRLSLAETGVTADLRGKGRKKRRATPKTSGQDVYKIVKMLMERKYDPAIVFSFSKRECERLAIEMAKLDLNTLEEKEQVALIFGNAIDDLSREDKKLPAIKTILPLLQRGVGIHHGGLFPVVKEVIEILFQEGLIKALFATETFAMGLNMPARTVVFTDIRKFDGVNFRSITSGEYIQMSGRAGRRGKDTRGIVILMLNDKLEPRVGKELLLGKADPLDSQFYLSYNMLLNLIRTENIESETMLMKSFHQFQNNTLVPELKKRIAALTVEKNAMALDSDLESKFSGFFRANELLLSLREKASAISSKPEYSLPFLQPGRVVHIRHGLKDWGFGVVVNFRKGKGASEGEYFVDTLIKCTRIGGAFAGRSLGNFVPGGSPEILPFPAESICEITAVRLYVPRDLTKPDAMMIAGKALGEATTRFPKGLPLLDPLEDMKINEEGFEELLEKIRVLEKRCEELLPVTVEHEEEYQAFKRREDLSERIAAGKRQFRDSTSLILQEELRCMMRVLRRLGHINADNVIEMKGRVASEVNAGDELVISELIFSGMFSELDVHQLVAVLSCFLFEEKSNDPLTSNESLLEPFRLVVEAAKKVAKVSRECKVSLDETKYIESFRPQLMEVVFDWARGASFREITEKTSAFEGTIIRTVHRLEELLKQLCDAAKAIGNTELEVKFAEGISAIKRDVVFCPSLYL